MKILMVTSMFPPYRGGGVSSHVHDLTVGLAEHGHEVWVLSSRKGKRVLPDEGNSAPPGTRVIFVRNFPEMFVRFSTLARRERFDVVHFHSFNALATAWAGVPNGTVRLFTMHSDSANYLASVNGWKPGHPLYRLLKLYEKVAIRFPEVTIAVSKRIDRYARDLGALEVVYLPNAVDCDYWMPAVPEAVRDHSILVPRMLVPKNGVEFAIRSMKPLLAAVPRASMKIAGDGPLRDSLASLAQEVGRGRVRFLGEVPRSEMRKLYQDAGVVLIPSIPVSGLEEATSIATIEAMACGRPVVASNIGGLPELIRDGENGFLVPPKDPAALAKAASNLMEDPALARRLGARARQTALDSFSVPSWTERVLKVYDSAVRSRPVGASLARG